jgi:hypothetical protein
MPTAQEIIDAIDVQLNSLQSSMLSSKTAVDYTEGDVRVKNSQRVDNLLAMREHLLKFPDAQVDSLAFDFDISEFGVDNTQFES